MPFPETRTFRGVKVGLAISSMPPMKPKARAPLLPKSSTWYHAYFAAVVESDPKRALFRMASAQNAIRNRIAELSKAPPTSACEFEDLKSALNYLGLLLQNTAHEDTRSEN